MSTVTGRFKSVLSNMEEVPKGTLYMVTTNRAQLAAAIKAVDAHSHTIIEAFNDAGQRLVRYTFKNRGCVHPAVFEAHLKKAARNVMKTPASYWR